MFILKQLIGKVAVDVHAVDHRHLDGCRQIAQHGLIGRAVLELFHHRSILPHLVGDGVGIVQHIVTAELTREEIVESRNDHR